MIRVRVEASTHGVACEGEVDGGRLLDFADEHRAAISFSCRGGTCGTCRVRVLEGGALLAPRSERESETLAVVGDGPDVRLACVARVTRGVSGTLRIVALD